MNQKKEEKKENFPRSVMVTRYKHRKLIKKKKKVGERIFQYVGKIN